MHAKFFYTKDVLKKVDVSRNTLFLWFKHHKIPEVRRDRNGHRIFTKKDIESILYYKNRLMPPRE
ncbi:MAG: MerR family transcriptional regulator [Candidatus Omnitrophota bacterium]